MRYFKTEFLMVVAGLIALGAAQACDDKAHDAPVKPSERTALMTTPVHMCRDTPAGNHLEMEELTRGGWRYAGPLYNDGINCTVTLWTCLGECAPRKMADATGTDQPQ